MKKTHKKVVDNEDVPYYSYREALVHKLSTISPFLPKTISTTIKDGKLTIEMEKLEEALKEPTPENKIKAWKQVLQAVALLNHFKIAHRDIKEDNIMYRNGEDAVLIDFGLSKTLYDGYHTPNMASPYFRPPELDVDLEVQKYGFELDSWSLGILAMTTWNKKFNAKRFIICWNLKYGKSDANVHASFREPEQEDNLKVVKRDLEFHNANLKALKLPEVEKLPEEAEMKRVAELRIESYFNNIPAKISKIVRSFLLPAGERKVAGDWVKIDSQKCFYTWPKDFDCVVPPECAEWTEIYKSIYWSMKEYFQKEENLTAYAVLGTSYVATSVHTVEDVAKKYKIKEELLERKVLEWFVQWSVTKKL